MISASLPELNAAIAHGEAVLAATKSHGARMQQLAGIPGTMGDFQKLERIAVKAQERAQVREFIDYKTSMVTD